MCSKKIKIDNDKVKTGKYQKPSLKKKKSVRKSNPPVQQEEDHIEESDTESRLPAMKW
ncbi:MAG TPA: hypothetical protein VM425_01620 [Myxococcota bacterium]|nr:hypothetical protein [Myxococcota bacterium]